MNFSIQGTDAQGQFTAAVDDLIHQLQHKFDTVSREMFGKCGFTLFVFLGSRLRAVSYMCFFET